MLRIDAIPMPRGGRHPFTGGASYNVRQAPGRRSSGPCRAGWAVPQVILVLGDEPDPEVLRGADPVVVPGAGVAAPRYFHRRTTFL